MVIKRLRSVNDAVSTVFKPAVKKNISVPLASRIAVVAAANRA
jgi:hypothetical protein